jgi:hypothetical protein
MVPVWNATGAPKIPSGRHGSYAVWSLSGYLLQARYVGCDGCIIYAYFIFLTSLMSQIIHRIIEASSLGGSSAPAFDRPSS